MTVVSAHLVPLPRVVYHFPNDMPALVDPTWHIAMLYALPWRSSRSSRYPSAAANSRSMGEVR